MLKPITIVGGGLAGLSLGIGLRKQGVPVVVWEAGYYPRHRVCGEFVSGAGLAVLRGLGMHQAFLEAGAIEAQTAAFFTTNSGGRARVLPIPALCLSRFVMDELLAARLTEMGGELRQNQRWSGPDSEPGVVRASGRRMQPSEGGWRWFGLKVHARNLMLSADLEMHVLNNGYVGLCRLRDEVNICGLFRRRASTSGPGKDREELLRGDPGTSLSARLADTVFDQSSFCAVGGLSLRPMAAVCRTECSIGDALTMTPPVTGNGMSMAFESAALAVDPLVAYSKGELSWRAARDTIAQSCSRAFGRRLAWAKWLQGMMFTPLLQGWGGALACRSQWLWQTMFANTR
jgi:flavin-dependent dehydrogenase